MKQESVAAHNFLMNAENKASTALFIFYKLMSTPWLPILSLPAKMHGLVQFTGRQKKLVSMFVPSHSKHFLS
jgi:hypothetical protein